MRRIDLNTDAGESFGRWQLGSDELFNWVSSANIACGMHAGDPMVIDRVMDICIEKGVAPGAHPGFPDIQGFGRRNLGMSPKEVENYVLYQIGSLKIFAESKNTSLAHVKPHGALYNMAAADESIALAVARGTARASENLVLVGLAGSLMKEAAAKVGIPFASEGYCDRAYHSDSTLVSRTQPGAVITDAREIAGRAVRMVLGECFYSVEGKELHLSVDTICIHGDTPGSEILARAVRQHLEEAGISVASLA